VDDRRALGLALGSWCVQVPKFLATVGVTGDSSANPLVPAVWARLFVTFVTYPVAFHRYAAGDGRSRYRIVFLMALVPFVGSTTSLPFLPATAASGPEG